MRIGPRSGSLTKRPIESCRSGRREPTHYSLGARLVPSVCATPQFPDSGKKPPAKEKQAKAQQDENSAKHAAQQDPAEDDAERPDELSARFAWSFEGMPPLTPSKQPRRERAGSKPQDQRGRDQDLHPVVVTDCDDAVDTGPNEERGEHDPPRQEPV